MAMARAAGAGALGVNWGYHPVEDLLTAGAHCIAEDFSMLHTLLENRFWDGEAGHER